MNPGASRSVGRATWPVRLSEWFRSAWQRASGSAHELPCSNEPEDDSPEALASLALRIKDDLRRRFTLGERPTVAEYVDRYPVLLQSHDRMISLVYEEFCLREEQGERPDLESFCRRYEPWRESLISQLRYHDDFSRLASTPMSSTRFPEPGGLFRRFRLCSELGRGGVARVYLARDDELGGRKFALKLSNDQGEEPSIQGRLDHPHIVAVTHVEHEPETGLRGLFMPYWPGLPLNRVIESINPMHSRPRSAKTLWNSLGASADEEREIGDLGRPGWSDYPRTGSHADAVAWVGLKLAEALAHAHGQGIVHRDIKPANILLTRRGGPLLLDFNLASAPKHAEEADAANRGGTLPYMAPEQLRAFLEPDLWDQVQPPADLFSLGLVLRELLVGEQPLTPTPGLSADRAVRELLELRAGTPTRALYRVNGSIPHALNSILARCVAPEQADRYRDAKSFADDLRRFLSRRPLRFAQNPSRRENFENWLTRNRKVVGPATVGAVAIPLIYAGTLALNPGKSAQELVHLGSFELSKNRFGQAIPYFQQAVVREPNLLAAHQGLAAALKMQGEHATSVQHYATAIDLAETSGLDPLRCARLHYDAALTLCELVRGLHERAAEEFKFRKTYRGPAQQLSSEAEDRCRTALAEIAKGDLELDLSALASGDPDLIDERRCNLLLLSAELHLRLGEVVSLGDRYHESVPLFRKAKEQFESAESLNARLRSSDPDRHWSLPVNRAFEQLDWLISDRLEIDSKILAARQLETSTSASPDHSAAFEGGPSPNDPG